VWPTRPVMGMAEGVGWQLTMVTLPQSSGLSDLQLGVRAQMAAWRHHASWHCATLASVWRLHQPYETGNRASPTACVECLKDWPCPTIQAVTSDG